MNRNLLVVALVAIALVVAAYLAFGTERGWMTEDRPLIEEDAEDFGGEEDTAFDTEEVPDIEIEPDAVDPDDLELLEDLIIAGVNKALEEAGEMAQDELRKSVGGMLPPGMDLGQLGL